MANEKETNSTGVQKTSADLEENIEKTEPEQVFQKITYLQKVAIE